MLSKITNFFKDLQSDESLNTNKVSVEMACTVLLFEVMRADGLLDRQEQEKLSQIISGQFALSTTEVRELINQATQLSEDATDFHQFTSTINNNYQIEQKIHMVSLLWQLAIADGEVASIEEHVIRKVADLLHLRHAEYIQAKSTIAH